MAFDELLLTRILLIDADGQNQRVFWERANRPHWSADGTAIMGDFVKSSSWTSAEVDIRIKEVAGKQREGIVYSAQSTLVDWFSE